jgi:hypothetical protein
MRGGSERARKIVVAVSLGLVSLGLAALVFATIRRLIKAGKAKKAGHDAQAKKEKETEEKAAGLERALRALGSEADALAGAGRFREAIHTLLLDSIAELKKLSELPFPGSLTSRELSVGLPLTQEQKRAFTELVESAEPAWFGPDEGTPEGWRLARASFGRLLRATRAKGGAPQ